jgi:hypothetical protein
MDGLVAGAYVSASSSSSSSSPSSPGSRLARSSLPTDSHNIANSKRGGVSDGSADGHDEDDDDFRIVSITAALVESVPAVLPAEKQSELEHGYQEECGSRDAPDQKLNALEQWIAQALEMRNSRGLCFEKDLRRNARFQNPAICAKMIAFCGLDEHGTNTLPRPAIPDPDTFYDTIAERQRLMSEQQAQQKRTKRY